jgi:hypothetical protein
MSLQPFHLQDLKHPPPAAACFALGFQSLPNFLQRNEFGTVLLVKKVYLRSEMKMPCSFDAMMLFNRAR